MCKSWGGYISHFLILVMIKLPYSHEENFISTVIIGEYKNEDKNKDESRDWKRD